jgi:two-component system KDP operon response regulator KdpE
VTAERTGASILVIDDEMQIRRFLRISLTSQGYDVLEADTAARGLELTAISNPDLVVLDLGLPDADGQEVLEEIRAWSTVPVIVLSVRSSETEKVLALDGGANDYVTKPFGIQEFLARVRNLLRPAGDGDGTPGVFDDGMLRIDLGSRRITLHDDPVHLTPKEYRVLQMLLRNAGRVVTQTRLLREVWGPTHEGDTHYLRVVVGKIRHKFQDHPDRPRYIETEPGVGYRFLCLKG